MNPPTKNRTPALQQASDSPGLWLVQGPLAGYSCWPMRVLTRRYGPPALSYTEMLSAQDLAHRTQIPKRFSDKHPDEGPLCVQLSGTDPDMLKRATERALTFGADAIDLNCGCPVTKIRHKGAGSKLLEQPRLLETLVSAMKSVSPLPVSIKIRVDGDSGTTHSVQAARVAEGAGIDFITVHGRHWTERYDTPCRHAAIADIVSALSIPVIANGDATDTASTLALLRATGAHGVMIARASVGQPWLFEQIRHEAAGLLFTPPTPAEIGQLFTTHLDGLIALEGEKIAVLQSRKLIRYYARFLPADRQTELAQIAQKATTRQDMAALVVGFFEN